MENNNEFITFENYNEELYLNEDEKNKIGFIKSNKLQNDIVNYLQRANSVLIALENNYEIAENVCMMDLFCVDIIYCGIPHYTFNLFESIQIYSEVFLFPTLFNMKPNEQLKDKYINSISEILNISKSDAISLYNDLLSRLRETMDTKLQNVNDNNKDEIYNQINNFTKEICDFFRQPNYKNVNVNFATQTDITSSRSFKYNKEIIENTQSNLVKFIDAQITKIELDPKSDSYKQKLLLLKTQVQQLVTQSENLFKQLYNLNLNTQVYNHITNPKQVFDKLYHYTDYLLEKLKQCQGIYNECLINGFQDSDNNMKTLMNNLHDSLMFFQSGIVNEACRFYSPFPTIIKKDANEMIQNLKSISETKYYNVIEYNINQLDKNNYDKLKKLSLQKQLKIILACDIFNLTQQIVGKYGDIPNYIQNREYNPNYRIDKMFNKNPLYLHFASNNILPEKIENIDIDGYKKIMEEQKDLEDKIRKIGIPILQYTKKKQLKNLTDKRKNHHLAKLEIIYKNAYVNLPTDKNSKQIIDTFTYLESVKQNENNAIHLLNKFIEQNHDIIFRDSLVYLYENNLNAKESIDKLIAPNQFTQFIERLSKEKISDNEKNELKQTIESNKNLICNINLIEFIQNDASELLPALEKFISSDRPKKEKEDYINYLQSISALPNSERKNKAIQFFQSQSTKEQVDSFETQIKKLSESFRQKFVPLKTTNEFKHNNQQHSNQQSK